MDQEYESRLRSPVRKTKTNTSPLHSPERTPPRQKYSDRFIPSRTGTDLQNALYTPLTPSKQPSDGGDTSSRSNEEDMYQQLLRTEVLLNQRTPTSLFKYQHTTPSPNKNSPIVSTSTQASSSNSARRRRIQLTPYKVLDAPLLQDDFYLNLVDWGESNILAVGLADSVYLWQAATSKVVKLCSLGSDDPVASVSWMPTGTHIAVGTSQGMVQLWDVNKCKLLRRFDGHSARVGCLGWNPQDRYLVSSGSRDRSILHRDIRIPDSFTHKLVAHRQEVCGLKWSPDGRELASGGNDNKLFVWHQGTTTPALRFLDHTAAVKAIAWSPHQHGILASGGGTADRCIRFWNTASGSALSHHDTGSQVCNLAWSKNVNELVSTHGYSQNQICVWKYPSMTPLATLTGHTMRVLYLSVSPDGQTVVTAAGDETLRFWNIFPPAKPKGPVQKTPIMPSMVTDIR